MIEFVLKNRSNRTKQLLFMNLFGFWFAFFGLDDFRYNRLSYLSIEVASIFGLTHSSI